MNPPAAEGEGGLLAWRLGEVEKAIIAVNGKLDRMQQHTDERLDRVQTSISGLQFVRQDVYNVEMRGRREFEEETRKIALAARTEAEAANGNIKWSVAIIVMIIVAVLGAFTWVAA